MSFMLCHILTPCALLSSAGTCSWKREIQGGMEIEDKLFDTTRACTFRIFRY